MLWRSVPIGKSRTSTVLKSANASAVCTANIGSTPARSRLACRPSPLVARNRRRVHVPRGMERVRVLSRHTLPMALERADHRPAWIPGTDKGCETSDQIARSGSGWGPGATRG
jgi:hypothetical protein